MLRHDFREHKIISVQYKDNLIAFGTSKGIVFIYDTEEGDVEFSSLVFKYEDKTERPVVHIDIIKPWRRRTRKGQLTIYVCFQHSIRVLCVASVRKVVQLK